MTAALSSFRNSPSFHPPMRTKHEKITSYEDLQKLIHDALRNEHPEWIGLNGESEMCEFYEARFAKLLGRENTLPKNQWQHQGQE
jgi:hypothetical protein